jgi:hypothetical protein
MTLLAGMGFAVLVALTTSGCRDSGKGQSHGPDGGPDGGADAVPGDTADAPAGDSRDAAAAGAPDGTADAARDVAQTPDGSDARPAGCPTGCPEGSVCVIPFHVGGESSGECRAIPPACRPEAGAVDGGTCNQCVGFTVCGGAFGCLAGGYFCGI